MHSGELGRKDIERIGTNIRDWISQVGGWWYYLWEKGNTVKCVTLLQKSNWKCVSNEPKSELAPDFGECRDTARSLQSFGRKPDTHVRLSLDMEDYYRIKDQENNQEWYIEFIEIEAAT